MSARRPARPAKVRIGPVDYRISEDPGELLAQELGIGTQVFGMGDKAQQLIMLRPGMAPGFTRQIMLHEIVHQLFDVAGLELPTETEEQVCLSLQATLLGVLRDNPELTAWLVAPD